MRLCALILTLAAGIGMSQASHATTIILVSVPEVLASSDLVFEGVLQDIHVVHSDQNPKMSTEYRFSVTSTYKGRMVDREIILRVPGGTDGVYHVDIDGMPHFRKSDVGRNFIIAAEAYYLGDIKHYLPYGLTQGVFWSSADGDHIYRNISGNKIYSSPVCMGGEEEEVLDAREFYLWLKKSGHDEVKQ
jgi:hypothetical protein